MADITSVTGGSGSSQFTATTHAGHTFDWQFEDASHTVIDSGTGVASGTSVDISGDIVTPNGARHIIVSETGYADSTADFTQNGTTGAISSLVIVNGGPVSMAGTGLGKLYKASVTMKEPNGKTYTLTGNGIDAAGAIGELQAKLAITDGLVSVVSSVRLTGSLSSGQKTAFDAVNTARTTSGTGYDDINLTLLQTFNIGTSTQVRETPTLKVRDVRNDLADSGRDDGSVNLAATEIVALAAAYQDPDGNGGGAGAGNYVPYKGSFALS